MRSIGMLSAGAKTKERKKKIDPFVARSSLWVRAPQSGIFRMLAAMGTHVVEGDLLGVVATPYGDAGSETRVISPVSGIIIGRSNIPLVNEGEALFHIARFARPTDVADNLEAFQLDLDPATDARIPEDLPIT
jgi:predicted deacylase